MPILKSPNQSFRWLAAELSIVVLGILIAFQVEEWRANRIDANSELANLSEILVDLERRRVSTAAFIATEETNLNSILEMFSLLESSKGNLDDSYAIHEAGRSISKWQWRVSRARDIGLLDSDNMTTISDPAIKTALLDYYDLFEVVFWGRFSSFNEQHQSFLSHLDSGFYRLPTSNFSENKEFEWRIRDSSATFPFDDGFVNALGAYYRRSFFMANYARRGNEQIDSLKIIISDYINDNS